MKSQDFYDESDEEQQQHQYGYENQHQMEGGQYSEEGSEEEYGQQNPSQRIQRHHQMIENDEEDEDEGEEIVSQNSVLDMSHTNNHNHNNFQGGESYIYNHNEVDDSSHQYQHQTNNQSTMLDAAHLVMNMNGGEIVSNIDQQQLDYYQQQFQMMQQQHQQHHQYEEEEDSQGEDQPNNQHSEEEMDQVNEMSFNNQGCDVSDYRNISQIQGKQDNIQQISEEDEEEDSNRQDYQHQHLSEEEDDEDDENLGGEMKAKFDRILGTFNEQQRIKNGGANGYQQQQHSHNYPQAATPSGSIGNDPNKMQRLENALNQSEKREGITDFKNKNLQNNVKGILNKQNPPPPQEEEDHQEVESPAYIEGVEQNNESLNIMINKRKMFTKPPMIPQKQEQETNQRAQTPDRTQLEFNQMQIQKLASHINTDYYQKTNSNSTQRSNSFRPMQNNLKRESSSQRPKSAKQKSQPLRQNMPRPQTANVKQAQQSFTFNNARQVQNDENSNTINQQLPSSTQLTGQKKPNKQLIAQSLPLSLPLRRPQTAAVKPMTPHQSYKPQTPAQVVVPIAQTPIMQASKKSTAPKKKTDPVSRYQNMQNQWKSNSFLKSSDNKQGRKLELDRFHKWSSLVHAHNQQTTVKKGQHKVVTNGKAPTEDRRDDMRFQLRAKISQKDYVDKQMRAFHYNQEIAQKQTSQAHIISNNQITGSTTAISLGEDKLEQLKKQIENLKRGLV